MSEQKYGPKELKKVGEALFGDQWQTDLSRDLGLSDPRRIRQWMSGSRSVPPGVWADLRTMLRARKLKIEEILAEIDRGAP